MCKEHENHMLFNDLDYNPVEQDPDTAYDEERQRLVDECIAAEKRLYSHDCERGQEFAKRVTDDLINVIKDIVK